MNRELTALEADVLETLRMARHHLSLPGVHIKGRMARDACGIPCSARDVRAVQFCAVGAVSRWSKPQGTFTSNLESAMAHEHHSRDVNAWALRALDAESGCASMVHLNDLADTTTADVLAAFTRAIERVGRRGFDGLPRVDSTMVQVSMISFGFGPEDVTAAETKTNSKVEPNGECGPVEEAVPAATGTCAVAGAV